MSFIEILLIAIGLSMDACAVSASNGMCYKKLNTPKILLMALTFAVFQGLMPLIGYTAGSLFSDKISAIDHWIALILLLFIGGKMVYDGFKGDRDAKPTSCTLSMLLVQGIATSIDALAVGISFAAISTNIYMAVVIIAITTFVLSILAIFLGKKIGDKLNSKAEIFGGTILILIGLKIFIEHVFFS